PPSLISTAPPHPSPPPVPTRRSSDLFCTAATMPASGSIYVVAHAIDSTGAPGRLSAEREIAVGSSAGSTVTIQGYQYMPANVTVDRKSTRLNSSHVSISYAVFCLKKK